jgi:hypothetical protein
VSETGVSHLLEVRSEQKNWRYSSTRTKHHPNLDLNNFRREESTDTQYIDLPPLSIYRHKLRRKGLRFTVAEEYCRKHSVSNSITIIIIIIIIIIITFMHVIYNYMPILVAARSKA